jgi:antitoxin (DNA-binding transcriptional repressor) of toxin-antitoxin stability system
VKARLSAYLKESEAGPEVVTRNGKAVAVLLAVTDEDELERLILAHSPKFQALLDKSRRQIEKTGGIPHDDFWREVAAETRADDGKRKRGARRTAIWPLKSIVRTSDGGAFPSSS